MGPFELPEIDSAVGQSGEEPGLERKRVLCSAFWTLELRKV